MRCRFFYEKWRKFAPKNIDFAVLGDEFYTFDVIFGDTFEQWLLSNLLEIVLKSVFLM